MDTAAGNVAPSALAVPCDPLSSNLLSDLKEVDSCIRWICTIQLWGQDKYRGFKGRDCLFHVENKSWPMHKG